MGSRKDGCVSKGLAVSLPLCNPTDTKEKHMSQEQPPGRRPEFDFYSASYVMIEGELILRPESSDTVLEKMSKIIKKL